MCCRPTRPESRRRPSEPASRHRTAPYHILYYDAELHAYRTDRFGGWTLQPSEGGTPLFGYGPFGYTKLTDLYARLVRGSDLEIRGANNSPSLLFDAVAIAGK